MAGRRGVFGRVLLVLGAAAFAPGVWAQEECSSCHDQKVSGVHEPLPCLTCHEGRDVYPHPASVTNPSCGSCHEEIAKRDALGIHAEVGRSGGAAPECSTCHGAAHDVQVARSETFRKAQPETCGMCHGEVAEQFQASVHGTSLASGAAGSPACTTCHGAHDILRPRDSASAANPSHIRETCAGCHENLLLTRQFRIPADRVLSFDQSFHGLAAKAGSTTVANCASCHGFHAILPSTDPKSSVHPDNLPSTCGQCHPGAGQRFAIGPVHTLEGQGEAWQVEAVTSLYLFLIPAVIGLMMLHNIGDFVRKLWVLRIRPPASPAIPAGRPEVRMLPFERIQHGLLVVSFSILVWSGFALKYSGEWWAQPLIRWEAALPVRGFVHRGAAIVLVVVSFIHLFSLFFSRRHRQHWLEMLPRREDVLEGWAWFRYNLGFGPKPASRSAHSYVEKAEYWAVIWGTAVMALTGWMLYANNFMLAYFPKWTLDLASRLHFYEAVLATLAIIVWHFYFVIFDPEVYPMDTAWLTGKSVRKFSHGHGKPHPRAFVQEDKIDKKES